MVPMEETVALALPAAGGPTAPPFSASLAAGPSGRAALRRSNGMVQRRRQRLRRQCLRRKGAASCCRRRRVRLCWLPPPCRPPTPRL